MICLSSTANLMTSFNMPPWRSVLPIWKGASTPAKRRTTPWMRSRSLSLPWLWTPLSQVKMRGLPKGWNHPPKTASAQTLLRGTPPGATQNAWWNKVPRQITDRMVWRLPELSFTSKQSAEISWLKISLLGSLVTGGRWTGWRLRQVSQAKWRDDSMASWEAPAVRSNCSMAELLRWPIMQWSRRSAILISRGAFSHFLFLSDSASMTSRLLTSSIRSCRSISWASSLVATKGCRARSVSSCTKSNVPRS